MENKMKLLLIEDDINTCEIFKKIERARKEIEFIKITNSETEGLKCVKQNAPEGIILDLELTNGEGSGFGFIKELRKLKLKTIPKIIVTTNICTDSVYDYLHANKVDFIFYKKQDNYSEENVINTLLLLRGYSDSSDYTVTTVKNDVEEYEKEISSKIDNELDLIGIGSHLQGRKYLHDSIYYAITNKNEDGKFSIIQYLAKKYKKSNSTISRAMQNAILYAWRISAIEDLTTYYTAKINYETGIPTPTEFIYYYANKIKENQIFELPLFTYANRYK